MRFKIRPITIKNGVCEIPLTKGYVAQCDEEDYHLIKRNNWHANVCSSNKVYATGHNPKTRKSMTLHRFILGLTSDNPHEVDHIDGNTLNNRRNNLRICTHKENNKNRKANKGSEYKGSVLKKDGRWYSAIKLGKRKVKLGIFTDPIEAARAYDVAATKHFGEFANLNFPKRGA